MSVLASLHHVCMGFGPTTLFDDLSIPVKAGERIGLIGRNGAGKSTLLKLMAKLFAPDSGEVKTARDAVVAYVPQYRDFDPDAPVYALAHDSLLALRPAMADDDTAARVMVNKALSALGFDDPEVRAGTLSGGWRKRLAIACGLAAAPDLLLLDEPTNHLDIRGILWLESLLTGAPFASVTITHDRRFLEAVATRVVELDRRFDGGYLTVEGGYHTFVAKRQDVIDSLEQRRENLKSVVRREQAYLAQGPKARTSKSGSRVEDAYRLIEELSHLKDLTREDETDMGFDATGRRTRSLITARGLAMGYGDRTLFSGLDLALRRGVKLGLVGDNGCGKTTLMSLLAGSLEPDAGEVRHAAHLKVVYFDQLRKSLDPGASLRTTLCPRGDMVMYQGRQVHITGYASRFLFRHDQLDMLLGSLSGGEQAKALIATLMLQPADVLMLDEPTNDLDLPTLEVLEQSLTHFDGAVVMVTHDRALLDAVCSVVLGFDGRGGCTLYADYHQWHQDMATRQRAETRTARQDKARPAKPRSPLSYLEKKELAGMEEAILLLEEQIQAQETKMADPVIARDAGELAACYGRLTDLKTRLEEAYRRWEFLETKARGESAGEP